VARAMLAPGSGAQAGKQIFPAPVRVVLGVPVRGAPAAARRWAPWRIGVAWRPGGGASSAALTRPARSSVPRDRPSRRLLSATETSEKTQGRAKSARRAARHSSSLPARWGRIVVRIARFPILGCRPGLNRRPAYVRMRWVTRVTASRQRIASSSRSRRCAALASPRRRTWQRSHRAMHSPSPRTP